MIQEQLWELWNNFLITRQITLPMDAEDFLQGKEDKVSSPVSKKQRYYLDYPQKIVAALDSEEGELARRMLYVLSLIRAAGPILGYGWEGDIRICARIGYTFDEILRYSYFSGRRFNGRETYNLARLLVELCPAKAHTYADHMLESESALKELIRKRKEDKALFLMMDIGCCLFVENPQENSRYLPALKQCADAMGEERLVVMLYEARNSDEVLRQRLRELVLQDTAAAEALYRYCALEGTIKELFRELEMPSYLYYVLLALRTIHADDRHRQFQKLYIEDPEAFYETWRIVAHSKNNCAISSIGLLAIMLQNGKGHRELEEQLPLILAYPDRLGSSLLLQGQSFLPYLNREDLKMEGETDFIYSDKLNFNYAMASELIGFYATLCTWVPAAKRFFYLLFGEAVRHKDFVNLTRGVGHFITGRSQWLGASEQESAQLLLEMGLSPSALIRAYAINRSGPYFPMAGLSEEMAKELAKGCEAQLFENFFLEEGWEPGQIVVLLKLLYEACEYQGCEPLLRLLTSKSKPVRDQCEFLLAQREEGARPLLEKQLSSYRGDAAQSAKRIIKRWDNERKFGKDFLFSSNCLVEEFCQDNHTPQGEKLVSWIPQELFSGVRYGDLSQEAPAIVTKYILAEYASLTTPYRIKACDKVAERLHPQDLQATLEAVMHHWMEGGGDTKRKSILLPYCIYGSDSQLIEMRRRMEEWAGASRGALAAYAVNGLALNGSSMALMMVDVMGTKFPNNQVKKAAKAAFAFAATALEIPEDELADRIVPNLGFNQEGNKKVDYGPRTFTVSLMPDFTLTVTDDEKGKLLKSLPKPGASDDAVKAEKGKKEFSILKKQMKAVIQTQSARLEKALMDGRRWTASRWTALFVENPIMHRFATGLIWGVYEEETLTEAFRYMEDGTFNTVEEMEYTLPETASIALVHPIELAQEALDAWKQQLEDYEVIQPISQLSQPCLTLESGDRESNVVTRYKNRTATVARLTGMSKKYNLLRGDVLDGGSYTCFHLWDKYLEVGVQFNFEFMYMGQDFLDEVPLDKVLFYHLPKGQEQPYDEIKENAILDPDEIRPRFVSYILAIMEGLLQ